MPNAIPDFVSPLNIEVIFDPLFYALNGYPIGIQWIQKASYLRVVELYRTGVKVAKIYSAKGTRIYIGKGRKEVNTS